MKRLLPLSAIVMACVFFVAPVHAQGKKIRVLIIDGQNNHNWKDTTPYLQKQLESTGKFTVDVSTTPPSGAKKEAWAKWNPDFSKYDVVLSNYNGPAWPAHVQGPFEKFIANGGGLVNVHAANNAHRGWEEFEKMTGLLWRGNRDGWRVALNDKKEVVKMEPGKGPGAGHGPQHGYEVVVIEKQHPITKGMPMRWLHTKDELYHGQRGPANHTNILTIAFSANNKGGTGMYEPITWWIPYGKGKVVTTVLGHVGRNDATQMPAMKCVGFVTTVQRACEWAATGEVTIPVPDNFPTAAKTSTVD